MWRRELKFTYTHIIPTSLVGCASRKALVSTTPARDVGISHLSLLNRGGHNRPARPGWGGTAPSKSLIGLHRLETETTANTLATRSRIGHKQRTITAVSLGAWQRLSPDSETRTEIDSYRVGLKPPFNVKNGW
jgi:hypothetical protein